MQFSQLNETALILETLLSATHNSTRDMILAETHYSEDNYDEFIWWIDVYRPGDIHMKEVWVLRGEGGSEICTMHIVHCTLYLRLGFTDFNNLILLPR